MNNTMSQLYEKGLIKGNPDSGFEAVETMEERDRILQLRLEEEQRAIQLSMEMNQTPPPSIGIERQKTGQQLEFTEPPVQHNQKQPSGIPNITNRAQSRKAAA